MVCIEPIKLKCLAEGWFGYQSKWYVEIRCHDKVWARWWVEWSQSSGGDAKYEKEKEEHQQLWQAVKGMELMCWAASRLGYECKCSDKLIGKRSPLCWKRCRKWCYVRFNCKPLSRDRKGGRLRRERNLGGTESGRGETVAEEGNINK